MLTLTAGDATLELAPGIGGGVVNWHRRGRPIFRETDAAALAQARADGNSRALASYPLIPFSGRVAERRFTWMGQTYDLPERFGGFAIHGVGWLFPWTVVAQEAARARIELDWQPSGDWPFAFRGWQEFALTPDGLAITIGIENRHDTPAPCGFGLHPFYPRSPGCTLQFNAASVWLNERPGQIPSRRIALPPEWQHATPQPVGAHFIDNNFAGWDGRAVMDHPALGYRLTLTADPVFGHTVVYVPDGRDFFAVEPVSHMNDALNRMNEEPDHGVLVLAPGEAREGTARFAVVDR